MIPSVDIRSKPFYKKFCLLTAVFRNQNIPAVKSHSPDQAEPVHTEVNMCKDAFTPRRSGRGVVPNRRFQDMEVDFGRRKIKEDMPGMLCVTFCLWAVAREGKICWQIIIFLGLYF